MITSKRRFGIEIEFAAPTESALRNISKRINVVRDGSLDSLRNAGEYVSPILQGENGYKTISEVCEVLKKNQAEATAPQTSVHVHLDGGARKSDMSMSRLRPSVDTSSTRVMAVSNRLRDEINRGEVLLALQQQRHPNAIYQTSKFDGITYYSKADLSRAPRINYTYYWLERPDRFTWLRNMFYFYTMFSDVMEDIVSNSRKFGNMYCIPLGKSYDLPAIAGTKNEAELKNIWYKGRGSNGHYDDSRYHNVNLHCYWDRHGTVEIRSHGGTIDPGKIALWVMLHQAIADKLETYEFEKLVALSKTKNVNLYKEFIDFVEDEMLQEYIKRLLGYYSSINIK